MIAIGIRDPLRNTDNIVCVDTVGKKIIWIPRDLYLISLGERINAAMARGGLPRFMWALQTIGFPIAGAMCIPRQVCFDALKSAKIVVPVEKAQQFYYPLEPNLPIEEGKKIISFEPPQEILSGERIHQFLGARYLISKTNETQEGLFPDIERIKRQQVFLKACLEQGLDWEKFLHPSVCISAPWVVEELKKVNSSYTNELFEEFYPFDISHHSVLIINRGFSGFIKKYVFLKLLLLYRLFKKLF